MFFKILNRLIPNRREVLRLRKEFAASEEARQEQERRLMLYAQDLEGKSLELESARAVADLANRMKDEFLASMSHEIRTPMNGIIGMTELMLETSLDKKQKHYAETVLHSAESLLLLINDILDLSKVEAGKMDFELVIFDMQKLAQEVIDLFAIKAEEKAITIKMDYGRDTPRYVAGDPVRVRQIFSNLISNAIKFTHKGYVYLSIETNREVKDEAGTAALLIKVKDTGIGISQEAQKKVFDKFSQADASTTRKYGGTGLGLAICKQLVGMMGGEIGLTSQLDVGTTFWVTLKLRQAAEPIVLETNEILSKKDVDQENMDHHILLAEDNIVNQMVIQEILIQTGCRVSTVENGALALDFVKEHNDISLILMDCHMPVMDGFEAARAIRNAQNSERMTSIPIVALTALAMNGDRERCLSAGMDDYLSKPVRKVELLNMVEKWARKPVSETEEKIMFVDEKLMQDMHQMLGEKYDAFLAAYMWDTSDRLKTIGNVLASGSALKNIIIHAHSISSSSAYVGAIHLSTLASAMEMKAADDKVTRTEISELYQEMQNSFSNTSALLQKNNLKNNHIPPANLTVSSTERLQASN